MSLRWLISFILIMLLPACGDSADDAGDTTVQSTTTSSEVSWVDDAAVISGWVQVPHSPDPSGADGSREMNSVVTWEDGFVAVGGDGGGVGRNAAVWISVDGLEWSRIDDPGGLEADGWQTMKAVVAGGPGLAAVGTSAPGLHRDDAAVWTSVAGLSWVRVPDDSGIFTGAGDHQMADVVAGGPGFVAVGLVGSMDDGVAAVWTSEDGLVWSRVAHDDEVFGGDGWQFITGVVLSPSGFVAVGGDGSGDDLDAAVWTSPDGLVWTRVVDTDGARAGSGDQAMVSVTSGGPGLVAIGREKIGSDFDSVVWVSPDGVSWTRIDTGDVFGGPGDQVVARVAGVRGRLMAVGYERVEDRDAQVWDSTDGLTWVKSTDASFVAEGLQELHSLASSEQRVVAVGYSGDIAGNEAAVWYREN